MKGGSGFEYYLQRSAQERASSLPRAPLKLLSTLKRSDGRMKILELASSVGMEIWAFMEAVREMQEDGLVSLEGSTEQAKNIEIQITPAGRNVLDHQFVE